MILATRFTFIVERSWKNMYFHPKLAWPPSTYDVISRNHSNWPSLSSSQNQREGWTNSYWKRQVLMFYPLGKNSERPRVKLNSERPKVEVALSYLYASWLCFWFAFFRMKDSTNFYDFFASLINNHGTLRKSHLFSYRYKNLWDISIYLKPHFYEKWK